MACCGARTDSGLDDETDELAMESDMELGDAGESEGAIECDDDNAMADSRALYLKRSHKLGAKALDNDLRAVLVRKYGARAVSRDVAAATRAFVAEYYGALTASMDVEVRYIDKVRGKGLFSKVDAPEGVVLLHEPQITGMQHIENRAKVLACSRCLRMLGPIESALARLTGLPAAPVPLASALPRVPVPELPTPVPCAYGSACSSVYCSRVCRDADANNGHHALLCAAASPHAASLARVWAHAQDTNEAFEAAAQVLAIVIGRYRENGGDLDEAWLPFALFRKDLWWNVAAPNDDDEEGFRSELQAQVRKGARLLRAALAPDEPALAPLFAVDAVARVMGMFEMNNLSMLVPTPLDAYVDALVAEYGSGDDGECDGSSDDCGGGDNDDGARRRDRGERKASRTSDARKPASKRARRSKRDRKATPKWFAPLIAALGEDKGLDPEGAGMFVVQSNTNHSCEPNVESIKDVDDTDGFAVLSTLRPIKAGEELFISYVDAELPFRERQLALLEYRFECQCPRCVREGRDAANKSQGKS